MADEDDFLMGGGSVPSCSFLRRGDSYEGTIVGKPQMRQQLDFDTRKPAFWENGDPKMQLVVTIQTDEEDPEIEDDDGRRRLYVRYTMRDAIQAAVKEAGAKGLREGGWIKVTYVSQDKAKRKGAQGTKRFTAEYEAPDENADTDQYLEGGNDEDNDDETPEPPKRRSARKPEPEPPKRRSRRADPEPEPDDDDDEPDEPAPTRSRRGAAQKGRGASAAGKRSRPREDVDEYTNDGDEPF